MQKDLQTNELLFQNLCLLHLTLKLEKLQSFSYANLRSKYFLIDCPLERFTKNVCVLYEIRKKEKRI